MVDPEHVRLVKKKIDQGLSMRNLAKAIDRSSGTVHKNLHRNNNRVHKQGECDIYARLRCKYAKATVL